MKYIERLQKIATILISDEQDTTILSGALKEYKSLLLEIADVNLEAKANKENIPLNSGMAIGLTWAAQCVEDVVRTRQFIKGIFKATSKLVNDQQKKSPSFMLVVVLLPPWFCHLLYFLKQPIFN